MPNQSDRAKELQARYRFMTEADAKLVAKIEAEEAAKSK